MKATGLLFNIDGNTLVSETEAVHYHFGTLTPLNATFRFSHGRGFGMNVRPSGVMSLAGLASQTLGNRFLW